MTLRGAKFFALPLGGLLLVLSGCNTIGYYWQAIDGHLEIMRRATSFEEALARADAGDSLRLQLVKVREIREFASKELALPDNGSYRRYADLGRSYALWNVFAAPEFSVRAAESCFPVAGCVPYRGFYREADARAYARQLAEQGLDTYVGGVAAYSTLGWFDDPVLSTFIGFPDGELARIIFHELAHQVAYVRGDAQFNESFAVAVEQVGVRRWLASRSDARSDQELRRWSETQLRRSEFISLLIDSRSALARLYDSSGSEVEKRSAKSLQLQALQRDYERLRESWGGFRGYDRLFAQGANNALLASVAVYTDYVPAFAALLEKEHGNLSAFYAEVRRLADLTPTDRVAALRTAMEKSRN